MGYIRVPELDLLLQHFDGLKELLKALRIQLDNIKNDREGEAVYAAVTNRNFDDMPGTGRIADKTAKIALNLPRISGEHREAIRELSREINLIGMVIDKLELAKRLLSPAEQKLIYLRHEHGRTLQEISTEIKCSKAKIQKNIGQALERMAQACRIEQNEYQKVLQILKG
jgi:DNA-directed RNA polymerase specialized sigma24 family protein